MKRFLKKQYSEALIMGRSYIKIKERKPYNPFRYIIGRNKIINIPFKNIIKNYYEEK